jgi:hypothetical protein
LGSRVEFSLRTTSSAATDRGSPGLNVMIFFERRLNLRLSHVCNSNSLRSRSTARSTQHSRGCSMVILSHYERIGLCWSWINSRVGSSGLVFTGKLWMAQRYVGCPSKRFGENLHPNSLCFVPMAEAMSRIVSDSDRSMISVIRHTQLRRSGSRNSQRRHYLVCDSCAVSLSCTFRASRRRSSRVGKTSSR